MDVAVPCTSIPESQQQLPGQWAKPALAVQCCTCSPFVSPGACARQVALMGPPHGHPEGAMNLQAPCLLPLHCSTAPAPSCSCPILSIPSLFPVPLLLQLLHPPYISISVPVPTIPTFHILPVSPPPFCPILFLQPSTTHHPSCPHPSIPDPPSLFPSLSLSLFPSLSLSLYPIPLSLSLSPAPRPCSPSFFPHTHLHAPHLLHSPHHCPHPSVPFPAPCISSMFPIRPCPLVLIPTLPPPRVSYSSVPIPLSPSPCPCPSIPIPVPSVPPMLPSY